MSYCRWSSGNYTCDLYVYATDDGISIHVANKRRLPTYDEELIHRIGYIEGNYLAACELINQHMEPIGGPSDGASYYALDAESAVRILLRLDVEGYHFPNDVVDRILDDHRLFLRKED
jgi:hypothetical protein